MSVIIHDPEQTRRALCVSEGPPMKKLLCPSCRAPRPEHRADCEFHPADIRDAFDYDDPMSSLVFL